MTAADPATGPAKAAGSATLTDLPAQFSPAALQVSVTRLMPHGLPPLRLMLDGSGMSTLERNGRVQRFGMDAAALLAAVDGLLRLRFFALPDRVPPVVKLQLRADGSVGRVAQAATDTGSTQVCLALPAGRKCVAYGRDAPAELEAWVSARLDEATQRVRQAAGGASTDPATTPAAR